MAEAYTLSILCLGQIQNFCFFLLRGIDFDS